MHWDAWIRYRAREPYGQLVWSVKGYIEWPTSSMNTNSRDNTVTLIDVPLQNLINLSAICRWPFNKTSFALISYPPCGLAFVASKSPNVTSFTNSLCLWTSPSGKGNMFLILDHTKLRNHPTVQHANQSRFERTKRMGKKQHDVYLNCAGVSFDANNITHNNILLQDGFIDSTVQT